MNKNESSKFPLRQLALAVLIGVCASSPGAYAAPGGSGGGGNGGGGGSGGSGSGGGAMQPPDFGDLFVLYRGANGVPILDANSCQQPITAPENNFDGCDKAPGTDSCLIPLDPATCAVLPAYATLTQEVEFGRTNAARSPDSVFEAQLEDAIVKLATADCVTQDPAGRLVASTVGSDNVVTSATIDSPLQNLAIYKQLMLKGYLGADSAPLTLPASPLDIAARGIGAASDKGGKVSVDMVVYLNQILGLTDPALTTYVPKNDANCIDVKEEVKGVVQLVHKCFLDYGSAPGGAYSYNRTSNFADLPSPAHIPAGAPEPGIFEYLVPLDLADPSGPTFQLTYGPILDAPGLFTAAPATEPAYIGPFAQAADDARAVINFMHSWPAPGSYATPLTCAASGDTRYDVAINDVSGLQVPVRMVAGTEGREFTLTVSNLMDPNNSDPALSTAKGMVELAAKDSNGRDLGTFPRYYSFDTLAPGQSLSWTEGFTATYPTTITWTATAITAHDVNPANDVVSAATTVTGTGGGTGGGGAGKGGGIR